MNTVITLEQCVKEVLLASQYKTIAETIREAAINYPVFLGDVECQILYSFQHMYQTSWKYCLVGNVGKTRQLQARTFMLLVAEALE